MNLVNLMDLTCNLGGSSNVTIPGGIVNLIHLIFIAFQIVVPILLIIWGMLDFAKAVIGQDEDKIKAGQKTFIKRLIAAVIVFLILTIVQLVINIASSLSADSATNGDPNSVWTCAKAILNGDAGTAGQK